MTLAQATIPAAADESALLPSVGGLFIEALARRDFAALANSLDPSVQSLSGGPMTSRWPSQRWARPGPPVRCPAIPELFERYGHAGEHA